MGLIYIQGALDNGNLVRHLMVVSSRSPARRLTRRSASQGSGYGAGRCGVADTHVSGAYDVRLVFRGFQRKTDSCAHALMCLFPRHRWTPGDVVSPAHRADGSKVRVIRQRRGQPGINTQELHSRLARHNANRRTTRQEVQHHLGRDLLGIAGNALGDHAVIARGHNERLAM